MEADVDGLIGAGRHERSGERSTWRNGYRDRSLDTRLGTLNLKIPKLRTVAVTRATDAGSKLGMSPQHLLVDRHRPQMRGRLQHRQDLRFEEILERIRPSS